MVYPIRVKVPVEAGLQDFRAALVASPAYFVFQGNLRIERRAGRLAAGGHARSAARRELAHNASIAKGSSVQQALEDLVREECGQREKLPAASPKADQHESAAIPSIAGT